MMIDPALFRIQASQATNLSSSLGPTNLQLNSAASIAANCESARIIALNLNRKCDCGVPRGARATLPPRFCRIPLRDADKFILHSRRRRADHEPPSIAVDQLAFFSFSSSALSRSLPSLPLSLFLFLFPLRLYVSTKQRSVRILNDY